MAQQITGRLASNGITVVSGLARGIDGLCSGLDRIYPPEHGSLAEGIAASGAIIRDYSLGTRPEGSNFPPRNRIICGLSSAIIVVEAGKSSGALSTAEFGADQGCEAFAVPGGINSPASQGTNGLIRDGAQPYLELEDVLEVQDLELAVCQQAIQQKLPADETEGELRATLSNEPVYFDALQQEIGQSVYKISAALALLELKGHVRQAGGMHYVLAREEGLRYSVE